MPAVSRTRAAIYFAVNAMKILNTKNIYRKSLTPVHNYEHEQAPMVTDLRRRPVMGFFTVALRPGESTDGQLGRD